MDFQDTPQEAAYRTRVKAWLAANRPAQANAGGHKRGDAEFIAEAKVWQAIKADNGFAGIRRPKEWGGGGGTMMEDIIFSQEEDALGLNYGAFMIGIGMCVPTVLAHGHDAMKQALVTPTIRGEKIWCQLFSEPSAGSDMAGLRTRAVRDGDGWLINGQKVWNTFAHRADYGLLLVRTSPDKAKHKGLTMFWVDMHDPAVDVRPIHQASGDSDFNEVYLTDLKLPDDQRIGEVDNGWNVALTTLLNERMSIMGSTRKPNWEEIMQLARTLPGENGGRLQDQAFREQLADWYVKAEGVRLTRFRLLTDISRGGQPGPSASVGKIINSTQLQEITSAATELQDQYGIIDDETLSPMDAIFQRMWAYSPGARLGGGTDEIMKNIIAERVLGMPGDIRVDKDTAFKDLPAGRR